MALGDATVADTRFTARDVVQYRARAFGPDARALSLLIVNLSAQGLMARHDGDLPIRARLRIALPVIGVVAAEVRWACDGRIGCALDATIDPADYYDLLAVLVQEMPARPSPPWYGTAYPERSSATPASRSNR